MTDAHGKRVLESIRKIKPFIQASLIITKKRCGRPSCRCAREGPIHETALLTWKEEGKTRALYVPVELRKEVSSWVEEGKHLKKLILEMSRAQTNFLLAKKARR
jgi:hypothetical protein